MWSGSLPGRWLRLCFCLVCGLGWCVTQKLLSSSRCCPPAAAVLPLLLHPPYSSDLPAFPPGCALHPPCCSYCASQLQRMDGTAFSLLLFLLW